MNSPGCYHFDWTTSFLPRLPFPQVLPSWCMSKAGALILAHYYWISLTGNFWISISLAKISQQSRALPTKSSLTCHPFSTADWKHTLPTFSFPLFYPHGPFPHKSLHFWSCFGISASGTTWTDTRDCPEGWGFKVNKTKLQSPKYLNSCFW